MGERANYILVRDEQVRAFRDQHGAYSCLLGLAEGPAGCEERARDGAETDELMSQAWCEGAFLLDFDRKVVLFFGSVDRELMDEDLPEDALAGEYEALAELSDGMLLFHRARDLWTGWTAREVGGVDDLVAHLAERGLAGQVKHHSPGSSAEASAPRRAASPSRR